jgi:hypothetical protein
MSFLNISSCFTCSALLIFCTSGFSCNVLSSLLCVPAYTTVKSGRCVFDGTVQCAEMVQNCAKKSVECFLERTSAYPAHDTPSF